QITELTKWTRSFDGCLQAEDFRGTEFPDNHLHLQLWESSAAMDAFWTQISAKPDALQLVTTWQAPHHHGKPSAPRRQGENGIEFYRHVPYSRLETSWGPSDEEQRPASVRFPAW